MTTNTKTKPESQEIEQATLDEGLIPELSDDFFHFEGRKVQIKPLKVKYQKQFAKTVQPIMDQLALDVSMIGTDAQSLSIGALLLVFSGSLKNADAIPRLIQVLCHNDAYEVTDEEIDESTMQISEMQGIVMRYIAKNGEIEKKITDFFIGVLPKLKSEAVEWIDLLEKDIQNKIKEADKAKQAVGKVNSTTTA